MTGICYITEKSTEYLAEQQVDAIVRFTEDDAVALKLEGNFSPEKADHLIEEAIANDCDRLVFVTENKNVDVLSRLIPQEYGVYFEDIQVIEENYNRLEEEVANPQTGASGAETQQTSPANGTNPPQDPAQPQGDKIVFICNAAAPNAKLLQQYIVDRNKIIASGIQDVATPEQLKNAETWFMNVDSAGLTASGIKTVYEHHPSEGIRKAIKLATISTEGFDCNFNDLSTMATASQTVRAGHRYVFIVPKKIQAPQQLNGVLVESILPNDYENPLNAKILPLIGEVAKFMDNKKSEVKKRSDLPTDEEELSKALSKDEAKIKFIIEYAKAFQWWTKYKDKRMKTKEAESQFAKAFKEFATADLRNAWNSLKSNYGKGIGFMANSIEKMVKGAVADMKGKKDDEKDKEAHNPEQTIIKKIFSWEHYNELCKLLFEN